MPRLLFILFCGFMLASCGGKGESGDNSGGKKKGNGDKSELIEVKLGDINNYLEETGEIIPRTIVKVKFNFNDGTGR